MDKRKIFISHSTHRDPSARPALDAIEGKLKTLNNDYSILLDHSTLSPGEDWRSSAVKAWSVTLGTAVLGFSVKESNWALALVTVLPVICFWFLDAYYLALEKSFRDLWETAVACATAKFKMKVDEPGLDAWWGAAWQPAVWLVHLRVFISSLLAALILFLVHTPK
jgi:hypothetical protein